ncbi:MAG: acyl-ACP--UDP-N-acetylglucosamine O-acyltransferase, partial [Candidatus Omnitrophica bacterium]|nr:acyl-ACP--UDP-N-acetylglucosamine O-acyltransferase [Candidatus Omnitrophota bacterium]
QDLKYKGKVSFLEIGKGNTIREYVTINPATEEEGKTRIGDNNLLMAYSHVAHDCCLGSNIVIANAATLAGFVTVEDSVILGGLVGVHQFTRIGTLAFIGGCSKVVQDVLPYSLCDGHPATTRGLNIIGLRRAGFEAKARSSLKNAFKLLAKSEFSTLHTIKKIEKEIEMSSEITRLINFIKSSKRGICS